MEKKTEFLAEERIAISNRKARHDFEILESFEAGIVLKGSEIKSIRQGKANLQDSYAALKRSEVWLYNLHISPYEQANQFNHDPVRDRKLLLHRSEIRKLIGKTTEKGLTLVPLKIYFKNGVAKLQIALAKGKKNYDKREDVKKRDSQREMQRVKKNFG